jgi:hypothetical protein
MGVGRAAQAVSAGASVRTRRRPEAGGRCGAATGGFHPAFALERALPRRGALRGESPPAEGVAESDHIITPPLHFRGLCGRMERGGDFPLLPSVSVFAVLDFYRYTA